MYYEPQTYHSILGSFNTLHLGLRKAFMLILKVTFHFRRDKTKCHLIQNHNSTRVYSEKKTNVAHTPATKWQYPYNLRTFLYCLGIYN